MSKRTIVRRPEKKGLVRQSTAGQALPLEDSAQNLWQQLFIISERWQSDLAFFNDELIFFRKLIDKYFMWLIDEKNIESTRKLASELSRLDRRRVTISQTLGRHVKHLANMVENPFSHNAQQCRDEHSQLETLLAEFTKDFRQVKSEVFTVSVRIIESEKAKHLLNGI